MKFWKTILIFLVFVQMGVAQKTPYDNILDSLNAKADNYAYIQKDSAYFYLNQARKMTLQENMLDDYLETYLNENWIAAYHYDLVVLEENLFKLDSTMLTRKKDIFLLDKNQLIKNYSDFQKGTYRYLLEDYDLAIKSFNNVLHDITALPDSLVSEDHLQLVSLTYSYLASMYLDQGKYNQALDTYENNIRFQNGTLNSDPTLLNDTYSLLASAYKKLGKIEKSNYYFLKSLKYFIQSKGNLKSTISAAQNLVENHIYLSQLDSAQHYLNIIKGQLPEDHPFQYRYHNAKAELHKKEGNYVAALDEFNQSLVSVKNKWKNAKHSEIATTYNDIGLLHLAFNKPKLALNSYDQALTQLDHNVGSKVDYLKVLKNKVVAQNTMATSQDFKLSMGYINEAVQLLDTLKPSFKNNTDKLFLIEDAYPLLESGLEAACSLIASSDKEGSFIDKAFLYMEKSKSVLLLEALLSTKATKYANVPAGLLERESQLKSEITFIEKQINNSENQSYELEDQLFELKNDHRNLIQQIETSYPSYYNLKYNTEVMTVLNTQQLLAADELMISYFYGNEAIYAIAISNDTKQLFKIPISVELEQRIRSVHEMLGNPKSDIPVLSEESYSLYKKLVQPALEQTDKKKLIIIPDGLLNYLPFGSLTIEKGDVHYLVEDKTIAYSNSATLWAQLKERKNENTKILAFAPSFKGEKIQPDPSRDKLMPLPQNTKEVEQILTSFEGDSFLDSEASLANFNSNLTNHGILHLATHAIFDDDSPEYSYLAFTPNENEESLLYVRDLYNL
ncbi:MAG: CHAT domain-containing protein, partial [Flavobacteriaceae bacterium]